MNSLNQIVETANGTNDDPIVRKPFISLVLPAYNEASIIEKNLATVCEYMETLEDEFPWELIVVNDGSTDGTGDLAEEFSAS